MLLFDKFVQMLSVVDFFKSICYKYVTDI